MCGIAGHIGSHDLPQATARVQRMVRALSHRGPDGEGLFARDRAVLGHRRLSIIDLEGGAQPLSNEDGSVWITFNGEIYNYRELRRELETYGHRFRTSSDTEPIVHAFEQWGADCVRRFRGMFAFAVADLKARRVLLARDHFGIKPLYYRTRPDGLSFASEIAALVAGQSSTPAGSLLAIDLYLRFQYIPTPHTIYQDVWKLPPAHYAWATFDGRLSEPTRYWDLEFRAQHGLDEREWCERVETAIADSVRAHLVADVPVGLFLSGGIDSTLIAWHAARQSATTPEAFAIGFADPQLNELPYARQAASACGVKLHEHVLGDDALDVLPDLVSQYGEPFGDSSAIATYHVSRLARRHVPVVLSGDGGDEAFAGYDSYRQWLDLVSWRKARDYFRVWPRMGLQWAAAAARRRALSLLPGGHNLADWLRLITYTPVGLRRDLWRGASRQLADQPCDLFEKAAAQASRLRRLEFAQYLDYQTYLPCDILTKVDIASMAHSLEARPPLVDREVVELAAQMPVRMRCGAARQGKWVLKKLLEGKVPDAFIYRNKQGFAIPTTRWLSEGRGGQLLRDSVLASGAPIGQLLEQTIIRRLADEHRAAAANHAGRLWVLLVRGLWLEAHPNVTFNGAERESDWAAWAAAAVASVKPSGGAAAEAA